MRESISLGARSCRNVVRIETVSDMRKWRTVSEAASLRVYENVSLNLGVEGE